MFAFEAMQGIRHTWTTYTALAPGIGLVRSWCLSTDDCCWLHMGRWTTANSARTAQALTVRDARAELAGEICVHKFINADGAKANLAGLREQSSWACKDFIEEGGWATIGGLKTAVVNAADVCAESLMTTEICRARASPKAEGCDNAHDALGSRRPAEMVPGGPITLRYQYDTKSALEMKRSHDLGSAE